MSVDIKSQLNINSEKDRLKSDLELFSYVFSHDLKKPIRVINNNIEDIKNHIQSAEALELIDEIIDASCEMQIIINTLLEYVRIEVSPVIDKYIELNDIVKNILDDLSKIIESNNVIIDCDDLPKIKAYPKYIKYVFYNIIDNAIKYRKQNQDPTINIYYIEYDKYYEFIIKDNGIGIEEEYFEVIFLLFQRLHTKDEYPGTGSGLAIVKKIIDIYNGKIWVESSSTGSCFHFTLSKEDDKINQINGV